VGNLFYRIVSKRRQAKAKKETSISRESFSLASCFGLRGTGKTRFCVELLSLLRQTSGNAFLVNCGHLLKNNNIRQISISFGQLTPVDEVDRSHPEAAVAIRILHALIPRKMLLGELKQHITNWTSLTIDLALRCVCAVHNEQHGAPDLSEDLSIILVIDELPDINNRDDQN
jgi:hypothetical protein